MCKNSGMPRALLLGMLTIKRTILLATVGFGLCGGALTERSQAHAEARVLVSIQPGVWVVEDYDEPIFYYDDYYWVQRGGGWYRSRGYTGGWFRVGVVPHRVRHIQRPNRYVHYRAPSRARRVHARHHRYYKHKKHKQHKHRPGKHKRHARYKHERHARYKHKRPARSNHKRPARSTHERHRAKPKVRDHRRSPQRNRSTVRVRDHRRKTARVRDHRRR